MELVDKLRNLLVMASADGSLTEREISFLSDRCQSWSIDDHQFAEAIEYALSDDATLSLPDTQDERIEMVQDLVRMMAADGKMAETEKQLFASAAARMNISGDELNAIIDSIL